MKIATLATAVSLLVAVLWFRYFQSPEHPPVADTRQIDPDSAKVPELAEPSPFDIVDKPADGERSEGGESVVSRRVKSDSDNSEKNVSSDEQLNASSIDWFASRTDQQLLALADALKSDPILLQNLVDIFRQEPDAERRKKLASLLGLVGGEEVTLLASELIFSGDSEQRTEGMDLLQAVQPGNAMARDIVSGMLATEVQPDTLIDALTALAVPGDVDDQSRAWLAEQVAWLTTHETANVRGISLDILSRWAEGSAYTDVFVSALNDSSRRVRASAAYALNGHQDNPSLVIDSLFAVLQQDDEHGRVKSAVVLALKSQNLTPEQQVMLEHLERQLSRAPRR